MSNTLGRLIVKKRLKRDEKFLMRSLRDNRVKNDAWLSFNGRSMTKMAWMQVIVNPPKSIGLTMHYEFDRHSEFGKKLEASIKKIPT